MSVSFGPKPSRVEETVSSGLDAPPNSPVPIGERFAAAVAELPKAAQTTLLPYGEREPACALDDAINDRNVTALRLLLDCGVKPDATHLRLALYNDSREALELLLKGGVDPNDLWHHQHEVEHIIPYMPLFLEHGAEIARFTEHYGPKINSLLHSACIHGNIDRVKTLVIWCGADVNQKSVERIPLVHATWCARFAIHGQDTSARTRWC